jgi:Sulfotransferase family
VSQATIPAREKTLDDDAFLHSLNAQLEAGELSSYRDLEERYPTVHVLGVPRSGTTLALQLLVAHTDIAYIDHVAAAFWRAPMTGLRLAEALRRQVPRPASYRSDHGRTASLAEPHEFSYLWARLLGTPFGLDSLAEPVDDRRAIDWAFFKRVLTNMCEAVEKPLLLKSFHAIWHLPAMRATLQRAVIIRVRRDPLAVAESLVRMREQLYGSRDAWASIKPKEYSWLRHEDYAVQIAGQIRYVDDAITAGLCGVRQQALVEVSYEDLCDDPAEFVRQAVAAVERQGGELLVSSIPDALKRSASHTDPQTTRSLEDALVRFADGGCPGGSDANHKGAQPQ